MTIPSLTTGRTSRSVLYLVPVPLSPYAAGTLSDEVKRRACSLKYYFVENLRTARRFLKAMDASIDIEDIAFSEINRHQAADMALLKSWLQAGHEIGVMSEAGCPAIADPGNVLVAAAHDAGARVVPLVGPNSMLLALMASGLNGQGFRFTGYLPVKEPERGNAIKEMETLSARNNETQIFMETPYRNLQLFRDVLKYCRPHTLLCIAVDITGPDEYIATRSVRDWKDPPDMHKRPAVFLLMAR